MNNESPCFANMAKDFIDTLNPDQAASFRDLLDQLQQDAQKHLSSVSRSASEAYALLDQIMRANP